jgi:hypothetical protein
MTHGFLSDARPKAEAMPADYAAALLAKRRLSLAGSEDKQGRRHDRTYDGQEVDYGC